MSVAMIYIPGDSISLVINNEPITVHANHQRFDDIVEAAKAKDWDQVVELVKVEDQIAAFGAGQVQVVNGEVLWNGIAIHNSLTVRIIEMMDEGFSVDPLIAFMENLMQNPSARAVDELYTFLEVGNLPITEDGHFLAYKRVREDYTDVFTGKFDNSIGQVVKMPRWQVNQDSTQTCSAGLHFCSKEYLPNFGTSSSNRTVIVKVNPRDVVSIPTDYNNTKARCCEYTVVGELTDERFQRELEKPVAVIVPFIEPEPEPELEDEAVDPKAAFVNGYKDGYVDGRNKVNRCTTLVISTPYTHGYEAGHKDGRAHARKKYK